MGGLNPSHVIESDNELRRLLFSIAYRMTGSVSETEDLVQETLLRLHEAERREPRSSHGESVRLCCRDPIGH
jgi:DNA-directed RNA polymerase specialized sigma24 family protein